MSIIKFKNSYSYSNKLESVLNEIRSLNEIKLSYSNVRYRRMWDTSLKDFNIKLNLEKGKWTDFILLAGKFKENNITRINPFSIHELYTSKLRISLLLFWKDVADKLSSDTVFKLQLNLNLTFT